MELCGQRRADPGLDRVDELLAAKAHIIFQRLFDAGAVTEVGQQLSELAVALEFALEQHAVEIEDDRLRCAHQSSNSAVPTRTAVAPSIAAALKSLDIPMLNVMTPCRRPSFASRAK